MSYFQDFLIFFSFPTTSKTTITGTDLMLYLSAISLCSLTFTSCKLYSLKSKLSICFDKYTQGLQLGKLNFKIVYLFCHLSPSGCGQIFS